MYALGRETKYYDMPVVRAVMRSAAGRPLSIFRAGAGDCEERAISDENEGSGPDGDECPKRRLKG